MCQGGQRRKVFDKSFRSALTAAEITSSRCDLVNIGSKIMFLHGICRALKIESDRGRLEVMKDRVHRIARYSELASNCT